MTSSLFIISFMNHAFGILSKFHNHTWGHWGFLQVLEFLGLHFTFRPMIHFELILMKVVKSCLGLFFACGCPVQTFVATLYCLCSFIKDQWAVFMRVYFWALYSALLIYSFTNTMLSWLLHCWVLTLGSVSPPALFSYVLLAILSLLPFFVNFWNCTSISMK